MSDMIAKSYNSIKELPSEVRSSFDERDQQKWMDAYNEASENKDPEEAKVDAWMSMVDAPSSLAVETWGSVEVRDADGELVPVKTIEEYADKFIENGGLMHDSHSNVPVGTVWDYEVRKHPETGQDGIVFYFNIYRDGEVFERARADILSGRKNAVSIGAEAPRGGYKCDDRGCYVERDVTDLYELSICETPANPEAYFINVGKDIAKAKTPIKGEVFRIGIKDVVVHQDYTTCPLQKCKHDLLDKGFKDTHITDNGIVTAKSETDEYKLFKAIHDMGYPFRYDLKKEQFEIMPDYGVEQAIEEAVENGWAHEDQICHICLTKEIPKEVFMDWYDRGFLCKIGDFYCLKADDVAKNDMKKSESSIQLPDGNVLSLTEREGFWYGRNEDYNVYIYLDDRPRVFVETTIGTVEPCEKELSAPDLSEGISVAERCINRFYSKYTSAKKVKKDGGAMGVGDAGATNAVYGSKPASLTNPDKKYGKKRKAKKEMIDDGNIHAVGSRQAKKSIDSISKRCPNGYHKDENGNCVNEYGQQYSKKIEQHHKVQSNIKEMEQKIQELHHKKEYNLPDTSVFRDKEQNKQVYDNLREIGNCIRNADENGYKKAFYNLIRLYKETGNYNKKTKQEFIQYKKYAEKEIKLRQKIKNESGKHQKIDSKKDMKKSYGSFFDAVENFIVDSPDGVYYNDILSEFSDSLDEDDILDALEQICSDGQITYNPDTERFAVNQE